MRGIARLGLWLVCLAVIGGETAALVQLYLSGGWITNASGAPFHIDFLGQWAAGHFALNGNAAAAYDGSTIAAFEHEVAVGEGYLPFPYPPIYFFVSAPLAALPYHVAFVTMVLFGLGLYALVIWQITGRPEAVALALAVQPVLSSVVPGQNGPLSAALIGGALLHLHARPMRAGLLFALLTYKPQFGILIPFALVVGRKWTALGVAFVASLALGALAGVVFGFETYRAFISSLPENAEYLLETGLNLGDSGWRRLQSVYGLVRSLGGSHVTGLMLQAGFSLPCAVFVLWFCRMGIGSLGAAVLSAGILLVTPYAFLYDHVILSIALAFLWRHGPFSPIEWGVVTGLALLAVLSHQLQLPIGFLAPLGVIMLAARRAASAGVTSELARA